MNVGVPVVPLKWRKYLALVDFGFQSADELAAEIRRYPRSKVQRLVSDIGSEIRHDTRRARRSLYVVKLVPADLQGQLPNFRLERSSQLKQLVAFLAAHSGVNYVEAWYCSTRIDSEVFSVAGRIVFTAPDAGRTQHFAVGLALHDAIRAQPRGLKRVHSESDSMRKQGGRSIGR